MGPLETCDFRIVAVVVVALIVVMLGFLLLLLLGVVMVVELVLVARREDLPAGAFVIIPSGVQWIFVCYDFVCVSLYKKYVFFCTKHSEIGHIKFYKKYKKK